MIELSAGKRVLNIGCCGSDALRRSNWVHTAIGEASSYCLGVDIFEAGIEKMRAAGQNVAVGNAENLNLGDVFDLVILGDVIEHVANPGLVFDSANRHLTTGGLVAATTPNPFSLTLMLKRLFRNSSTVNSEHVVWFDAVLLSWLMERCDFEVEEVLWTEASRWPPLRLLQKRRKDLHGVFGVIARKL